MAPVRHLIDCILHNHSFVEDQCWSFDANVLQGLCGRYNSETAEIYRFLPAFQGRKNYSDLFFKCMDYLRVADAFYKTWSADDPFEHTLPWYETVNMIVGVKQGDEAEDTVTSVLIF